jgi:hypothetical protein
VAEPTPIVVTGRREPFDEHATSEGWAVRVLTHAVHRVTPSSVPRRRVLRHFGKPTTLERALEGLPPGKYLAQLISPKGLAVHSVTAVIEK